MGNYANVDFDEIAVWNTELSAGAVSEIYNNGGPTNLTDDGALYQDASALQLYWRFEEGSGLATEDSSGNGHGGVLSAGDAITSWGAPGANPYRFAGADSLLVACSAPSAVAAVNRVPGALEPRLRRQIVAVGIRPSSELRGKRLPRWSCFPRARASPYSSPIRVVRAFRLPRDGARRILLSVGVRTRFSERGWLRAEL